MLESPERPMERAVRRQQAAIRPVTEAFRDFVTVKLVAPSRRSDGGDTNGEFKRHATARFSPHVVITSRYMPIVERRPAQCEIQLSLRTKVALPDIE
jgi:hypothetical protein